MAKSYRCLICGRATYKPPVTLPQGVIGPVCAKRVAPRLPLGRAKKTVQTAGKRLRRGVLNDQEARQASAFRPGKESAKPVRASLGATDQSAAVAQEHQPCELFPIARA